MPMKISSLIIANIQQKQIVPFRHFFASYTYESRNRVFKVENAQVKNVPTIEKSKNTNVKMEKCRHYRQHGHHWESQSGRFNKKVTIAKTFAIYCSKFPDLYTVTFYSGTTQFPALPALRGHA